MENQSELNKNARSVFERQSLVLNIDDNVKKFPSPQIKYTDHMQYDGVDNQFYKNSIKFSTGIPQVNKEKNK